MCGKYRAISFCSIAIVFFLFASSACRNNTQRNECDISVDGDSLYTSLIDKLGPDPEYRSVVRFLVDSIVPQYNRYELEASSGYIFADPGKYLTKMEMDSLTLVTMAETDNGYFHYFLLDSSDSIVDHKFSDTWHTTVLERTLRDWNGDGAMEVVERRRYVIQGLESISEFVYTVKNNRWNLLFCIVLSERSSLRDIQGFGHLTTRSYKRINDSLFYITHCESKCNLDEAEPKPCGTVSTTHYTISADSLIGLNNLSI